MIYAVAIKIRKSDVCEAVIEVEGQLAIELVLLLADFIDMTRRQ